MKKGKPFSKQEALVLGLLLDGERLTQLVVFNAHGVERLSARIHALREYGIVISDRNVFVKKSTTHERAKVKEYWLDQVEVRRVRDLVRQGWPVCEVKGSGLLLDDVLDEGRYK